MSAWALSVIAQNVEAESSLSLGARFEPTPGFLVEFYFPSNETQIVSGVISNQYYQATERLSYIEELISSLSITRVEHRNRLRELWERLTDAPPPEGLEFIHPGTTIAATSGQAGGGVQREPQPEPLNFCDRPQDGFLAQVPCPNWDWNVCLQDVSGSVYAQHTESFMASTNVCAADESIQLSITSSEDFGGLWTVLEGTHRWYSMRNKPCVIWPHDDCPTVRAEIFGSPTARFHFRHAVLVD